MKSGNKQNIYYAMLILFAFLLGFYVNKELFRYRLSPTKRGFYGMSREDLSKFLGPPKHTCTSLAGKDFEVYNGPYLILSKERFCSDKITRSSVTDQGRDIAKCLISDVDAWDRERQAHGMKFEALQF